MKISNCLASTLLGITLLASQALFASETHEQISQELHAFNDRFNEIAEQRDIDAFLNLYVEDAQWIAPATPPVEGHDAPRETFQFLIDKDGHLSHTIDKLRISDDGSQAVMIGTATVLVEQVSLDVDGTYLFVMEKREGEWKILTDMWHQHSSENTAQ